MTSALNFPKVRINEQQRAERFDQLVGDVLGRHLHLQDPLEAAALLESMGWNDRRVQQEFGMSDVFELAEEIWQTAQRKISFTTFSKADKPGTFETLKELSRSFLRGVIFALPMAISVISMLTLKFSLWSFYNLEVEIATSIAIGTILSFMTVGGFTQAIARRGFYYIIQEHFYLARKTTFIFIGIGFALALILSVVILVTDLVFTLFPFRMLFYVIAYYILLNSIWLSVTAMYILRRELAFTGLIMLGIALVFVLYRVLGLDIIFSQIVSISLVSILSAIMLYHFFRVRERESKRSAARQLPRMSIMLYSTIHYFIYGFLYFTFLYIDRVMAWSTNDVYMPYVIWFRGEYELGLDFALLMLILPMGFCEVSVTWFMRDLEARQKMFSGREVDAMNRKYLMVYFRTQLIHIANAVLSGCLMYWLAFYIDRRYQAAGNDSLLASDVTVFVLVWGIVGYVILSVFLMNAVIMFALSQPKKMNHALLMGLVVNFIVGFLLSRWLDYHYAVFGLIAGSLVAAVLSTIQIVRVIRKLDYYLFSAS